jgi:hypothetical protein
MSYRMVAILTSLRPKVWCLSRLTAKRLVPMIALTAGFCSGELCALILAGSATAADVPAKTPAAMPAKAPAAPAYSWTGCYLGANTGGAAGGSDFATSVSPGTHLVNPTDLAAVDAAGTGSANDSRFIGGGQVGCNWQTGTLVFGVEGDLDSFSTRSMSPVNGMLTAPDAFTITNSVKTNWLGTGRRRRSIARLRDGRCGFHEFHLHADLRGHPLRGRRQLVGFRQRNRLDGRRRVGKRLGEQLDLQDRIPFRKISIDQRRRCNS